MVKEKEYDWLDTSYVLTDQNTKTCLGIFLTCGLAMNPQ
jgi:hypothetical protein